MKTSTTDEVFLLLGRRVRAERLARRMTQQELAEVAGMDAGHLSRIEHGKAIPSVSVVKRLADAMQVPIARLFADIPPHRPPDYEWAGKIGAIVRDLDPRRRGKVLRALKTLLARED